LNIQIPYLKKKLFGFRKSETNHLTPCSEIDKQRDAVRDKGNTLASANNSKISKREREGITGNFEVRTSNKSCFDGKFVPRQNYL
jgi:hypothetical protein